MSEIPTFIFNIDIYYDIAAMQGIDISREIEHTIKDFIVKKIIIVTEEEYKKHTGHIISQNDFVPRHRYIAAKIIGIKRDDGSIKMLNTLGKELKICKNKEEFEKEAFIELL